MHKARAFFYVCAGIFLLALAYHFGAMSATAQVPGNSVVAVGTDNRVYTANGDMYYPLSGCPTPQYVPCGNVFGGPTPATQETWGGVKARYRPGTPADSRNR